MPRNEEIQFNQAMADLLETRGALRDAEARLSELQAYKETAAKMQRERDDAVAELADVKKWLETASNYDALLAEHKKLQESNRELQAELERQNNHVTNLLETRERSMHVDSELNKVNQHLDLLKELLIKDEFV